MARLLALALIALLGLAVCFTPVGARQARAEADHRATLERALALVQQAEQGPTTERWQRAGEAFDALTADPDLPDQAWLAGPLDTTPPDLPAAKARLSAALAELDAPATRSAPANARGQLDQVLDDPRFHPGDWTRYLPSWLLPVAVLVAAAIEFVGSLLQWPIDRFFDALRAIVESRYFGPALALLAVIAIAAVALLCRRGLGAALVAQAEARQPAAPLSLTTAEALALARERAASQDYRAASHYALLATLLAIEARDAIRFDRAATNREHLARLAGRSDLAGVELSRSLGRIVDRFDRLWYGQAEVSREDFEGLLRLVEDVAAVPA